MESLSEASQNVGCGRILFVLFLILTPIYLYFRYFMKVVRAYYGFSDPEDEGPPIRVCPSCDNTVLEQDFTHCPYCGAELPPESWVGGPPPDRDASPSEEPEAADEAAPEAAGPDAGEPEDG